MITFFPLQPDIPASVLYLREPEAWILEAAADEASQYDIVWEGGLLKGVPLLARRDGFLIFDFPKCPEFAGGEVPSIVPEGKIPEEFINATSAREKLIYKRFKYMNAFSMCYYAAYSNVHKAGVVLQEPLNPNSAIYARYIGHWQVMHSGSLVRSVDNRVVVSQEALDCSVRFLDNCYETLGEPCFDILSVFQMACFQHNRHQLSGSHILGWSIGEKLLNIMWQDMIALVEGEDSPKLKPGKQASAHDVARELLKSGKLSQDLSDRLDSARRKRNKFAHNLEEISGDDSHNCLLAVAELIRIITGAGIAAPLSKSVVG